VIIVSVKHKTLTAPGTPSNRQEQRQVIYIIRRFFGNMGMKFSDVYMPSKGNQIS